MERREPRRRNGRSWPLFGFALLIGLAAGLYYAWVLNPVVFVEASPARLNAAQQMEYVYLVGRSYAAQPNLPLAESRLVALDQPDLRQTVTDYLEAGIRDRRPLEDIRALAALAAALEIESPAVALFAPAAAATITPTLPNELAPLSLPTGIISATRPAAIAATPIPTLSLSQSLLPPTATTPQFQLLNREQQCVPEIAGGRIVVLVLDGNGTPQSGIPIIVSWPNGSDRFVTGFKEGGIGDFTMQPETDYTITLPDGRTTARSLRLEACLDNQPATWQLIFLRDEG